MKMSRLKCTSESTFAYIYIYINKYTGVCVQTKGALAAAAAASAVAAQVARGRGRAALARGAFVSAAAPGYVTPGRKRRRVGLSGLGSFWSVDL